MNILVTGGAGFIGSNLVENLLNDPRVNKVRVMDNLLTGDYNNIKSFESNPKFEFHEADIRDMEKCLEACDGINRISHQAALGSVPRSIQDPITTHAINVDGTLNIYKAAIEKKVDRVVFASSSSVYGDNPKMPKEEDNIGKPLSPYALTKLITEQYAEVFSQVYDFNFIALRYFNVFGPKQSPKGAYAAVIPIFMEKAIHNDSPTINGDGNFSRDFTYIDNAVEANVKSLFTENPAALNEAYNIAYGERTTLNDLWEAIKTTVGSESTVIYGPERSGDIPHSLANISKAKTLLKYEAAVSVEEGLERSVKWYKESFETAYF